MAGLRKFFLLLFACWAVLPGTAFAEITVAFYSHDFGSSFPHAFIVIKGTPSRGGEPVDANYGFTAKSVTPALLMGAVAGKIEKAEPKYIAGSDRQFAIKITDVQFDNLMALIEKWRTLPGKSYSLNNRNCIHFVGAAAQLLGLKVVFDQKLMKKPRSFMLSLITLNPWVKGN
jgi:hypothetical protein